MNVIVSYDLNTKVNNRDAEYKSLSNLLGTIMGGKEIGHTTYIVPLVYKINIYESLKDIFGDLINAMDNKDKEDKFYFAFYDKSKNDLNSILFLLNAEIK